MNDPTNYKILIERLIYLSIMRPDIVYLVQTSNQFIRKLRKPHRDVVMRILKHVKGTFGQGLLLPTTNSFTSKAFDWGGYCATKRPVIRYCIFLWNLLISWKFKKQINVSRSSAEAKYQPTANTCLELIWLSYILQNLKVSQISPIPLFYDNQIALHIATNLVFHEHIKHIEIDCHIVWENLLVGMIGPSYVCTCFQLADIFTKALGKDQFEMLHDRLELHNIHSPIWGGVLENIRVIYIYI